MSNEEIIKALRCCADESTGCYECPFDGNCIHAYNMDLKLAAANAIQTLCDELATYHAKSVTYNKRIADLETALAACRVRAAKGHECRFDCDFYDWTVGTCGGECVMLCEAVRGEHDA